MAQPSGTHGVTCPYCGNGYQRSNYMKRKSLRRDKEGRRFADTHEQACYNKTPEQREKWNQERRW